MDPERWERISAMFEAALQQADDTRHAWLVATCDDDDLRKEVERLLEADAGHGGPIDSLAAERLLSDADQMLGRSLGPYRLVERIAAGGMGVVYRGERADGLFAQSVAIKLVRSELAGPATIERFERERRTLAALVHPNIARLIDGGTDPVGRPYFVLELVHGLPIDRYCRDRQLDVPARLRLFAQVCRAVQYAHQNLVVHRDLKPANILVDDNGLPKLVDFGIARVIEKRDQTSDLALSTTFTPGYASPEQIAGHPTTTAVDVFGLGVVLYELLTSRRPFPTTGVTPLEWQRALLEQPPVRPSLAANGDGRRLRGDLDRIAMMALRKEPERRYASALDLAIDVERHLSGQPIRAREDSWSYRTGKFAQRHAVIGLAAIVAVTALIVGLVTALQGQAAAERSAYHAAIESESSQELADFLMDTFLTSELAENPDQRDSTREHINAYAARVRLQYGDQPHQRANLLDALGRVATRLRLDTLAMELLQEGLTVRTNELADQPIERSRSLQSLGRLHHRRGEMEAAAEYLSEGLELQRTRPHDSHTNIAAFANDLAACLRSLGQITAAEALHREAIQKRTADSPSSLPVAESLNNLAAVRLDQGDVEGATGLLTDALAIRRSILGPQHPLTLQLISNLAATSFRAGHLERAEALLIDAEQGYRAARAAGYEGLAQTLLNRAVLAENRGAIDPAIELLTEACGVLEKHLGVHHVQVVAVWAKIARAETRRGNSAAADLAWQRALTLLSDPESPALVFAELALEFGQLLRGREAVADAERWLNAALARLGDGTGTLLARIRIEAGELRAQRGDTREAGSILRAALTSLEGANADPELTQRAQRALAELGRSR